ncbi:MAG: hypothetical protein Faunusvirus46_7 [Faunusvirus sp.]|jgi:hypothetical protein|uniref:Uncharacterized protein n=1 Tax=Faunusvirus sp. TaxID=2487766 RepID=A0A3G4ZXW5_9VIRU|nr:MAG: hypothetical protein Faunusvirus46_7 [Faunusvirus sp.]
MSVAVEISEYDKLIQSRVITDTITKQCAHNILPSVTEVLQYEYAFNREMDELADRLEQFTI